MGEQLDGFYCYKQFDLTILDKLGRKNVVAYFLSRITNLIDEDVIDYHFLDEHLFEISLQTP
jgi:hypothetical protein